MNVLQYYRAHPLQQRSIFYQGEVGGSLKNGVGIQEIVSMQFINYKYIIYFEALNEL